MCVYLATVLLLLILLFAQNLVFSVFNLQTLVVLSVEFIIYPEFFIREKKIENWFLTLIQL